MYTFFGMHAYYIELLSVLNCYLLYHKLLNLFSSLLPISEAQITPTPSQGDGSDVPSHHIASPLCSVNSHPVLHATSSVPAPAPVLPHHHKGEEEFDGNGAASYSNSCAASLSCNGSSKSRVELTNEQV